MKIQNALGCSVFAAALLVACNGTVSLGSPGADPNTEGGTGGTNGQDAGGGGGPGDACTALLAVCPLDAPTNHQSCSLGCGQPPLQCHYDCAHGGGYVTNASCDGNAWSVAALLIACPAPVSDAGSTGCKTSADCANGNVCGFLEADGCSAVGSCVPPPPPNGAGCGAPPAAGCACDGSLLALGCNGLPSGYASKPLLHTGGCTDSGSSPGSPDGGSDAGDCCSATWDLYSCTYPDGGAGMACHNPQMGCVSSGTCGVGCDRAVIGRCGP